MTAEKKPTQFKIHPVIKDWVIPIGLMAFIYLMGWHTEVIGRMQQVVLATGIFSPNTEKQATTTLSQSLLVTDLSSNTPYEVPSGKTQVVFINFWASWCPPCIAEMPDIEKLYQRYKEDERIQFMMINLDNDPAKRDAFIARKNFDLPFFSVQSRIPNELSSQAIPATFVINKRGEVILRKEGMASYTGKSFTAWLDSQLEE